MVQDVACVTAGKNKTSGIFLFIWERWRFCATCMRQRELKDLCRPVASFWQPLVSLSMDITQRAEDSQLYSRCLTTLWPLL